MIDGYARQGKPALARRCFREMLEQPHESIQPDKFTYTALLKSYVMVDDFAAAEAGILTYRIPVLVEVGDDRDFGVTGQQAATLFKPAIAEIPARAAFLQRAENLRRAK